MRAAGPSPRVAAKSESMRRGNGMAEIAELQSTIDAAFEERAGIGPSTTGPARAAVEEALALLDRGEFASPRRRHGLDRQSMAEEGGAAVVPAERYGVIEGGPGGASWWDKVPSKFAGWGEAGVRAGRLPCRAGLHRPPFGLYRAGRRADAELRQSRRLCRQRHHGRYLGDGRLLRADRQERAIFPAASGSAACSSRSRPARSSSRIIASSARARKWSKA